MPVDYANKGKPKPKRKPAKKQRSAGRTKPGARRNKTESVRIPRLLVAAIAILLLAFASFLWLLTGDRAEKSETAEQPVTTQSKPQDTLPQAPQERWQYIRELETREVEVVVPERAESRRRLMQCGSFRREADAQALRAKIAMQGMESQVRRSESADHGVWFRVILGPFDGLREAQSANNQLRRGNVQGCQIWLWNLD